MCRWMEWPVVSPTGKYYISTLWAYNNWSLSECFVFFFYFWWLYLLIHLICMCWHCRCKKWRSGAERRESLRWHFKIMLKRVIFTHLFIDFHKKRTGTLKYRFEVKRWNVKTSRMWIRKFFCLQTPANSCKMKVGD